MPKDWVDRSKVVWTEFSQPRTQDKFLKELEQAIENGDHAEFNRLMGMYQEQHKRGIDT